MGLVPPSATAMSEATNRAERCRKRAEHCRALADRATRQASKDEFINVTAQWDELAREIEDIERVREFVSAAERA